MTLENFSFDAKAIRDGLRIYGDDMFRNEQSSWMQKDISRSYIAALNSIGKEESDYQILMMHSSHVPQDAGSIKAAEQCVKLETAMLVSHVWQAGSERAAALRSDFLKERDRLSEIGNVEGAKVIQDRIRGLLRQAGKGCADKQFMDSLRAEVIEAMKPESLEKAFGKGGVFEGMDHPKQVMLTGADGKPVSTSVPIWKYPHKVQRELQAAGRERSQQKPQPSQSERRDSVFPNITSEAIIDSFKTHGADISKWNPSLVSRVIGAAQQLYSHTERDTPNFARKVTRNLDEQDHGLLGFERAAILVARYLENEKAVGKNEAFTKSNVSREVVVCESENAVLEFARKRGFLEKTVDYSGIVSPEGRGLLISHDMTTSKEEWFERQERKFTSQAPSGQKPSLPDDIPAGVPDDKIPDLEKIRDQMGDFLEGIGRKIRGSIPARPKGQKIE